MTKKINSAALSRITNELEGSSLFFAHKKHQADEAQTNVGKLPEELHANMQTSKDANLQAGLPASIQTGKQASVQDEKPEKFSTYLRGDTKKRLKLQAIEEGRDGWEIVQEALDNYFNKK